MKTRKVVAESRMLYARDEKELKDLRLSIESSKVETIQKFESMCMKSPSEWRDNLINFRIRRRILNREHLLTL